MTANVPKSNEHVFVYGTLLPGSGAAQAAGRRAGWEPVSAGRLRGVLYDVGPFPGAVPDPAAAWIHGFVFELPSTGDPLAEIDAYEGFDPQDPAGSLFVRRQVHVRLDDGRSLSCWMWVYNRGTRGLRVIPHGDYRRWRRDAVGHEPGRESG